MKDSKHPERTWVKVPFQSGTLGWDLEALARALRLPAEDVKVYFTDGRRVSFILERRLAREVLRGVMAHSEGAGYDLLDPEGGKWEVRSISRGGVYFCPSYMVGSKRKFMVDGFLDKLSGVQGYILSDITLFPEVPYWVVPVNHVRKWWLNGSLGSTTNVSRAKALALLGDA